MNFNKSRIMAVFIIIVVMFTSIQIPVKAESESEFEIVDGVLEKYNGSGGVVTIPEGVTSIGRWAFDGSNVTEVIFTDSVTSIDAGAFQFSNIQTIVFTDSIKSIESSAFYGCNNLKSVTIPDSIINIGAEAFEACLNLKEVKIGNGVESIGIFGFAYCRSLKKITFGNSVKELGEYCFYGDDALTKILPSKGNKCFTSVDGILFSKDKSKILIYPTGKTAETYTIPSYVKSVDCLAFNGCEHLSAFKVDKKNKYFCSIDGVLYNKDKTEIIRFPQDKTEYDQFIIPETVTKIGDCAFAFCEWLYGVKIPKNTVSIGYQSFMYTSKLSEITIPDKVKTLGKSSFERTGVTKVILGKSLTSIGDRAFWDCGDLVSIKFNDALRNIGEEAFSGTDIKELVLPSKLETIGKSAFDLIDITNLLIPDSVVSVGERAFADCDDLKEVTIGDGLKKLENGVFQDCDKLTVLTMGKSVESIGDCALWGCGFINFVVPDTVKLIDEDAFYVCYDMKNIYVPKSVVSIGTSAFHEPENPDAMVGFSVPLRNLLVSITENSYIQQYYEINRDVQSNYLMKFNVISDEAMDKIQEDYRQSSQKIIDQAYIQTYASKKAKKSLISALEVGINVKCIARDDYRHKLTQQEACEITMKLYDLLGGKVVSGNNTLPNTENQEVTRAYNAGILITDSNSFKPNEEITNEQFCIMLATAIEKSGKKLDTGMKYQKKYKDINKVSASATDYMRILSGYKIFNGNGEYLKPQGTITKEQALLTIYSAYKVFIEN